MKYLIIGAGGTGGLISGFLARVYKDVTLIARGEHLQTIQENGLNMHFLYNEETVNVKNIKAVAEHELNDEVFDIIFVCVKAYSLKEVAPLIKKHSNQNSIIIPILNSLKAGSILRKAVEDRQICDGCIYLTGFKSGPGEISQNNKIFRIVYGFSGIDQGKHPQLYMVNSDLKEADVDIKYTSEINSAIFRKLCFTSAFAAVGLYHQVKAADIQENPKYRKLFEDLLRELQDIKNAAGFSGEYQIVEENLKILNQLSGEFTASLQKDIAAGNTDEREQLIFDLVRLAEEYQVEAPHYHDIANYLGYKH